MDESRNIGSGAASWRAFLAGAGLTGAVAGAGVLAGVKYADITVTSGAGMSKDLYN